MSTAYRLRRKRNFYRSRYPGKYMPFVDSDVNAFLILKGHCGECLFPAGEHFSKCPCLVAGDVVRHVSPTAAKKLIMEWFNGKG